MRTVLGSVWLTVGLATVLAVCLLALRGVPGWSIGGGAILATALLVAGFMAFKGETQLARQRSLTVVLTVAGGLAGAILAVVTSGSGTGAVSQDAHQLWVRVLGVTYDVETGPFESLYAKMLLWGAGIGIAYVGVASIAGAALGVVIGRRTKASTRAVDRA